MLLVWFAFLLAPGSSEEDSQWSPWYNISDGEVNMALPLQIEQATGKLNRNPTILFDVKGVAPTIDFSKVTNKGKVKVRGCMDDYSVGGDSCRIGKCWTNSSLFFLI